ncbi:MAG: protoheme IX farnesyltransferase [Ferruginibacter sp.]|nr:protoheme IX farnesyltransferase [Cytophagales bacterium]
MITATKAPATYIFLAKAKAYFELLKFRLSFLVAFSGAFGYLLGADQSVGWARFLLFSVGGFLITGAANILNQVIEKDLDKLMSRTQNRPLPSGRLSVTESLVFAAVLITVGTWVLFTTVSALVAALTLGSLALYAFVYTPLKRVGPVAVLVGAIPGALPPLIGWVAATGHLEAGAFALFALQFAWQFPHFWAIAWVLDEDYRKAGFKLLPSRGGKNLTTAFQITVYTLFLIPLGILPAKLGFIGTGATGVVTLCGVLFLMQTFYLMKERSNKAALRLMFGSFIYLIIVQIAFLMDKVG